MAFKNLREYLNFLSEKGMLQHISAEVEAQWEVSGIARCMFQGLPPNKRKALFFERIKGYDIPLVTAALGASREIYALALGCEPQQIYQKWSDAMGNLLDPVASNNSAVPVKEAILKGEEVDLYQFPIPIWTPGRDAGPYITAPCVITKDPETGIQNVGTYRMQVYAKNKTGILIAPEQHIGIHFKKYQERKEPMPVAVAIGVPPAIGLTSVAKVPYGVDEFKVAGGMQGFPVEVVPGETVNLMVPAQAEIILEGFIHTDATILEGPFGEYTGYMGLAGQRPLLEITCITHRKNPIYQAYTSQMPPSESSVIRGEAFSSNLWQVLVKDLKEPGVLDVHVSEGSASQAHILVQMTPQYAGHAKRVGLIAANLNPILGKFVTVVNEDIDIRDRFSVEWAVTYRTDPVNDIIILSNQRKVQLDPTGISIDESSGEICEPKLGSRVVIDATVKGTYPEVSVAPREYLEAVITNWKKTGLPALEIPERFSLILANHPAGIIKTF